MHLTQSKRSCEIAKRDDEYIKRFLSTFDGFDKRIANERRALANMRDSIIGEKRMSLRQINEKAGVEGMAESMVIAYLKDLADYCNFNEPLTKAQYINVSNLVVQRHGNLKATELMIFFAQLKSGMYGAFYGRFDPLMFMDYLKSFFRWRNNKVAEYIKQEEERRNETAKQGAVSLEEYFKIHPERKENSVLTKIIK